MADIVDRKTRSRMMAGIRSKDTRPELQVRRFLHSHGFRYRLHEKKLPGTPDIVLPKYNLVIFVHGCFWHRHAGCPLATMPDQNRDQWMRKFSRNLIRDKVQMERLVNLGWRVLVIWECGLKNRLNSLTWLIEFVKHEQISFHEWP